MGARPVSSQRRREAFWLPPRACIAAFGLLLYLAAGSGFAARAQDERVPLPTRAEVLALRDAKRAQLETADALLGVLEEIASEEERRAAFERAAEGADMQAAKLRAEAALSAVEPADAEPVLSDRVQLEIELAGARAELADAAAELEAARGRLAAHEARRESLAAELDATRADADAAESPPEGAEGELQRARAALVAVRRETLGTERATQSRRGEVFAAQVQLAERRYADAQTETERLEQQMLGAEREAARRDEAAATAALQAVEGSDPVLLEISQRTVELARERSDVLARLEVAQRERAQYERRAADMERAFATSRERSAYADVSESVGLLMRQERDMLPRRGAFREEQREALQAVREARYALVDLNAGRERSRLGDTRDAGAMPTTAADAARLAEPEEERIAASLALEHDLGRLAAELSGVESALRGLERLADTYRDYIDERVLWIPSARPYWDGWTAGETGSLGAILAAGAWLVDAANWAKIGADLARDVRASPLPWLLGLAALVVLLALRRRLETALAREGLRAQRRSTSSMRPTWRALVWTVLAAAPLPALFALLAWRLGQAGEPGTPSVALSHALAATSTTIAAVQFLRALCHPEGLGIRHFGWPELRTLRVRRDLVWIASLAVPAEAVHAALEAHGDAAWYAALGRLAFLVHVGTLALFFRSVLNPRAALVQVRGTEKVPDRAAWLLRLTGLWALLGVGTPIGLAILSLAGYAFTAAQLLDQLQLTILFFTTLTVVEAVALRWLRLAQRLLWIEQLRDKREAQRRAREAEGAMPEEGLPPPEEAPADAETVSLETQELLRTLVAIAAFIGVVAIWSPVIPAIGFLDDKPLYSVQRTLERVQLVDGREVSATVRELVAVTLVDVLGLALFLAALMIAWRKLPALLEITLFRRLRVGAGERYAIVMLAKYAMIAVGVVVVAGGLGLSWSKLQWLVAAISVGLGFGLQEIFANFVSGLILLFERPIRVGDIVTIGSVDGRVTRMRIRATTITDFDRRELIVPNREFVTGHFVNWSLSDPVTRVQIHVGVAYGTDTRRARELLLNAAKRCEHVLADPIPRALFHAFGESSLDLTLYAFIPTRDVYFDALNFLHDEIADTFAEAGIEIAFPQRDLHIVDAPGLNRWAPSERSAPRDTAGRDPAGPEPAREGPRGRADGRSDGPKDGPTSHRR